MTTESLIIDAKVPFGTCAICRKKPNEGEMGGRKEGQLDMQICIGGEFRRVTICRDCLAEHAPHTLATIEEGMLDGISFEAEKQ